MRVVVKEVGQDPEVRDIPDSLDAMHQIVQGYIENVFVGAGPEGARYAVVCNETGTLDWDANPSFPRTEPMPVNLHIPAINVITRTPDILVIHGPIFFCKYDAEGANQPLTPEEAQGAIEFLKEYASNPN